MAALILQNSCVTVAPPVPSPAVRENLGVVAIAPAQYVPNSNFVTFAKGKGAGAAKGAGLGAAGGASAAAIAAVAGPYGMVVAALSVLVLIPVDMAVGGVSGTLQAMPADTAKEVDSVINAAVAGLDAQNVLAQQLAAIVGDYPGIRLAMISAAGPVSAAARPDYAQLRSASVNTVLEIAITEIGFESCGPGKGPVVVNIYRVSTAAGCEDDPKGRLVDLFLSAQARLVRVADGAELFVRTFRYTSARREIPRWVAKDGRLLAEEFELAFRELAERMHDEVLLVTSIELPVPSNWGQPGSDSSSAGMCWLAPEYPKAIPIAWSEMLSGIGTLSRPADLCPTSALHFTVIDTLRPTLRWVGFPRDLDRQKLDPAVLRKIGDVRYDLKIWQAEGCERGRLVYERRGLPTPEHAMEVSLAPASRYFWSVRARFAVDGQPMAMRWANFNLMSCFPHEVPDWLYHRFVTPR